MLLSSNKFETEKKYAPFRHIKGCRSDPIKSPKLNNRIFEKRNFYDYIIFVSYQVQQTIEARFNTLSEMWQRVRLACTGVYLISALLAAGKNVS